MEYDIKKIDDSTWVFSEGFVRFFLLAGRDEALLIDTGVNLAKAKEAAQKLTPLQLRVINTHTDPDHVGGNKDFYEVFMHADEEENYRAHGLGDGTKIVPVSDGEIIDLGDRPLKIIWVPGHTPGSIAILDINRRYLFSGDTVQQNNEIFMFGPRRNMKNFVQSLEKLQKMSSQFDLIYACHGDLPVKPDIIPQLMEGAKKVIAGEIQGVPKDMFGNSIRACDVGCAVLLVD